MSTPSSPPARLANAQVLAHGRRRPVLHPSLLRVQQKLAKSAAYPKVHFGRGLTENGQTVTLEQIFVKLMMLPRGDLRSAFHGVSFASAAEESRRMQHVLNDFATRGEACYVDLANLFPKSRAAAVEPEPNRRPISGPHHNTSPGADVNGDEVHSCFASASSGNPAVVEDLQSVRVLLIASAGCGKTTLMTQYCPMQWARGELWAEKFDLVIAKEFRYEETRRIEGIEDLLGGWKRACVASSEDQQQIMDFIADNPQRVCLILDGLDETKLQKCSEYLQKVIRGEELCGIHLVLTSRATEDVFQLSESCPFDCRVELVGFLPDDVPVYVKRVLEGDKAEKLLAEIEQNPYLAGVMCTPYFAATICDLYRWRSQIPRCLSDVFELVILHIAERNTGRSCDKWESIGEDVKKHILDLGEFAFRMLVDQHLVFSEDVLQYLSLSDDAVGLGLLVACDRDADTVQRQWRFAHLSLQESLSAMFVAHGNDMYPRKVVGLVDALGPLSGHLQTFWQLLGAQLTPLCMDFLVKSLIYYDDEKSITDEQLESLLFDRHSFPEGLLNVLKSRFSQDSLDRLAERLLDGLVSGSGALAVENEMQCSRQASNSDFLKTLLVLWKRRSREGNVGILLDHIGELDIETAKTCTEAVGLQFSPREALSSCMNHGMIGFYRHTSEPLLYRCYAEYVQHHNGFGCENGTSFQLPALSAHLRKWGIAIMWKNACHALDLEQVIKHHGSDISYLNCTHPLTEPHERRLLSLLLTCEQLNTLKHVDLVCTLGDQVDLLSGLIQRNASSLVRLRIRADADLGPTSTGVWPGLVCCEHLQELTLLGHNSPRCVPFMSAAIAAMSELKLLCLGLQSLSANDTQQLLSFLSKAAGLKDLHLRGIQCQVLADLAAAAQNWPDMANLKLVFADNRGVTKEGCDALLTAVRQCHPFHLNIAFNRYNRVDMDDEQTASVMHLTGGIIYIDTTDGWERWDGRIDL